VFTDDGSCTRDIQKRLAVGRSVMQSLSSVWKNKDISIATKLRPLKALVWSVAIHGCEGCTLLSKDQKYIEAYEAYLYCFTYVWATVSALMCLVCPVLLSYVTVNYALFLENK